MFFLIPTLLPKADVVLQSLESLASHDLGNTLADVSLLLLFLTPGVSVPSIPNLPAVARVCCFCLSVMFLKSVFAGVPRIANILALAIETLLLLLVYRGLTRTKQFCFVTYDNGITVISL
jgi:hypothetical protein